MQRNSLLIVICLLGMLALRADGWSGNINGLLMTNTFNEHRHLGVTSDFSCDRWPVSIALDFFSAHRGGGLLFRPWLPGHVCAGKLTEVDIGGRITWRPGCIFQPYLGGGLAYVVVDVIENHVENKRSGPGWWINTGWQLTLLQRLNLGCTVRFSQADVGLDGGWYEAWRAGLLLGIHM